MRESAKKALKLGSMCSISYLAVYIARNTLSAVSPALLEKGIFTKADIGTLSSVYFLCYAIGQLINGIIGDKIKAKYMLSTGLFMAGLCYFAFSLIPSSPLSFVTYGAIGFFLSMIYAPMAKMVSENTDPLYTTRCSLGYTLASFLGSPAAGVLAAVMSFSAVFFFSSSMLVIMTIISFTAFTVMEKRKIIVYNQYNRPKGEGFMSAVKVLAKHKIVKFSVSVMLTGVVRTSVVFWMPTYFNEYLGYSSETSALIFTVATLIICLSAFLSVFVFERLGRKINPTMFIFFCSSAFFFLLTFLFKAPVLNVAVLIGAVMSSNAADSMIWSRYGPSLRDTGLVSTAIGFLDFLSYMAAAAASKIFSSAVEVVGWNNLILIWVALEVVAIIISLPDIIRKND